MPRHWFYFLFLENLNTSIPEDSQDFRVKTPCTVKLAGKWILLLNCLFVLYPYGGRAHYIIESKVQWKPFWLATQHAAVSTEWLNVGKQSGRYVNLRTPRCHGKKAGCEDAIVRVVSRSISAENLPKYKWTSKLSSGVGGHDRSLAELFSFSSKWSLQARWAVQVQWLKALPAISDGEMKWQGECVVHWKREEDSSSESQRGKTLKKRVWSVDGNGLLLMHSLFSGRALGYRTKAKVLLVVETQHRSLHTFCNDRERGGLGMDVLTFRTWGWRLLWENERWRSYTKKSQHQ